MTGFFLWGMFMAGYPFLESSEDLISLALFISAVLQLMLAVSMIILVLEEAREAHQVVLQEAQAGKMERQALETRVHLTEERYRTLFDQASEPIVITAMDDFRILELNRAAERLLALTRADAGRHSLTAFCQVKDSGRHTPDARGMVRDPLPAAALEPRPQGRPRHAGGDQRQRGGP